MRNISSEINAQLDAIEAKYGVQVLYACESGSRAWGFASTDSDYDARFIYAHPRDWYLSINIEHKRDVIELPIENDLDINGWDIRKALQLLHKSNPPLLEWLQSPIIYRDNGVRAQLSEVLPQCYSPVSCAYHYRQMAKRNRAYLEGETVKLKKYFYVLRPLLAVRWIEAGRGVVPTEFSTLLDAEFRDGTMRAAIDDLLQRKEASGEVQNIAPVEIIQAWIDSGIGAIARGSFRFARSARR